MEKANTTSSNSTIRKSFDFVIIGTLTHQSRDDALEHLEHLVKEDSSFTDINIIHIFNEKISENI